MQENDCKEYGSFMFRINRTNTKELKNYEEQISKEELLKYASLSPFFDNVEYIYIHIKDFCYNIFIPFKSKHELIIDVDKNKSSDNEYFIGHVYSVAHREIMEEKVKKR